MGAREGGLLLAPPKDERVAALQPHHVAVLEGAVDDQLVDLLLLLVVAAGALADEDLRGRGGRLGEELVAAQRVVQNGVGGLKGL